jgi:deoxyribonuclease-1
MGNDLKELRKQTRGHLHDLWEIAKSGNLESLSGEDKWLAKVMLDHEDQYFNQFEMADLTHDHEYDVNTEENPFIHIMLHSAIERQLESKDPIEALQFYNSMRKKKVSRHDAIHLIGAILTPLMFNVMQAASAFDKDKYIAALKKYKGKKPERIYEALEKKSFEIGFPMKKLTSLIFTLTVLFSFPSRAILPTMETPPINSFNKAKKMLERKVYYDHRTTFYCGCPFSAERRSSLVTTTPRKKTIKEHTAWNGSISFRLMPLAKAFPEWRNGHPQCVDGNGRSFKGRNCARKMAIPFRYMEADMYNLVPAIGEINGLRSNYSYAMIPGEKRAFGKCDMEIEGRKAEPPPDKRGNIARTYFYMDWAYPGRGVISNKNKKLFKAWDKEDPVDAWECERCKRIEGLQKNENPFVKKVCQEKGMW